MNLSFLKKVGLVLAKGVEAADAVADKVPFIRYVPGVGPAVDMLDRLAGVIVQTETIGANMKASGADKLKAAAPLVAGLLGSSSFLAGKKIADHALYARGASKIAEGLVDLLNSIDPAEAPDVPGS